MQDTDIQDLLETHGQYAAKMAFTYHISKHSASSYGSLVDSGANGGLAGLMFVSRKELAEKYLSQAEMIMNYIV